MSLTTNLYRHYVPYLIYCIAFTEIKTQRLKGGGSSSFEPTG